MGMRRVRVAGGMIRQVRLLYSAYTKNKCLNVLAFPVVCAILCMSAAQTNLKEIIMSYNDQVTLVCGLVFVLFAVPLVCTMVYCWFKGWHHDQPYQSSTNSPWRYHQASSLRHSGQSHKAGCRRSGMLCKVWRMIWELKSYIKIIPLHGMMQKQEQLTGNLLLLWTFLTLSRCLWWMIEQCCFIRTNEKKQNKACLI